MRRKRQRFPIFIANSAIFFSLSFQHLITSSQKDTYKDRFKEIENKLIMSLREN